ncbi:MAG: glycosyltransferase family 4 protein [Candidatus Curtissbacteria bacterium]|nr:glycosyltransferase family 4 protein [Candidatus Curtissbacteria bacterium]
MKTAFLIEHFIPFATGGSEWSTYYLAKDLNKLGHDITIITPNFGSKPFERMGGVKIKRFPIYKKIKTKDSIPGNFFFTNPLWIVWSMYYTFTFLKNENFDIIHVNGKYMLPPTRLANIFLHLPLVVTIRDYQVICNYGLCLWRGQKACNLKDYFFDDFKKYYSNYVTNKNVTIFLVNLVYAFWGRASRNILKLSTYKAKVVSLSNIQKRIFEKNGIDVMSVIGNSTDFKNKKSSTKENKIIYAGRFTQGKGLSLLISILPDLIKSNPGYRFVFVGDGPLRPEIDQMAEKAKSVTVLGQINHDKLLDEIASSKVLVAPSVWPEPFGRVAIEALSQKTPVVATNVGAFPEILSKRWGIIVRPTKKDLRRGIESVIKHNKYYVRNITKDLPGMKDKFQKDVTGKYLKLYKSLTA